MTSILIRGGECFDSETGRFEVNDILIEGERIKKVDKRLDVSAQFTVNAFGHIVSPGLIDGHLHMFPLIRNGVPTEAFCFPNGVTTAVDAGSQGCSTFMQMSAFRENTYLTEKYWLNVCSCGLTSLPAAENVNPAHFNKERIREVLEKYSHQVIGLKIRTSKNVVNELGYDAVRGTLELAEELDVPIMVHCTNPPGPMEELLDMLRPGDVLTHMYQNTGYTILDKNDHISQAALNARKRGVLFEAADARMHFSFEVGLVGIKEGFYPDFISTDGTNASMFQRPTTFSLSMQVNKYVSMGMPLVEVLKCCTINPAKYLGIYPERGSLKEGMYADIVVMKHLDVPIMFGDRPEADATRTDFTGKLSLKPVMTIKNGNFVYRDLEF